MKKSETDSKGKVLIKCEMNVKALDFSRFKMSFQHFFHQVFVKIPLIVFIFFVFNYSPQGID